MKKRVRQAVAVAKYSSAIAVALMSLSCAVWRTHQRKVDEQTATVSKDVAPSGPFAEVVRGPHGKSEIALTFDAGANAECFEDLIANLERAHVHSTFFITGNFAQRNMGCAAAITKHGHEIGNHTWNHLDLTKQPDENVHAEIIWAEGLLIGISGQTPRPRLRAPWGARDDRVLRIAAGLGYRSIYWTIDSLDSVDPPKTSQFLIDRITAKSDAELDGAIILMHVGMKSTAEALPAIIANLQGRGFRLVTISELLSPARQPTNARIARDAR